MNITASVFMPFASHLHIHYGSQLPLLSMSMLERLESIAFCQMIFFCLTT